MPEWRESVYCTGEYKFQQINCLTWFAVVSQEQQLQQVQVD